VRGTSRRARHAATVWGDESSSASAQEVDRPEEPEPTPEEDEGGAYDVVGGPERKCPHCSKLLAPQAELCVRCGFNLRTGQEVAKVYGKVGREWQAGLPYPKRLALFLLGQAVCVSLGLFAAVMSGEWAVFLFTWFVFTAMTAFLLGTFDQVNL